MIVLQEPFNELCPEIHVRHLRICVQCFEQDVTVQHNLIQDVAKKLLIPDFVSFSLARIARQHLVGQVDCTHLLIVREYCDTTLSPHQTSHPCQSNQTLS